MHAQLAAVIADLDAASRRLKALSLRLAPQAWHRRPAQGRWSAAECVAHLNLTSEAFLPRLHAGIDDARRSGSPAPSHFRLGWAGWLVRRVAGPSRWMRVRTPAAFVPTGDRPGTELVQRFEQLQDALVGLVRTADGLALDRVQIVSPFNDRLRYNVYAALSSIPGHQLRHLVQAEEAVHGH